MWRTIALAILLGSGVAAADPARAKQLADEAKQLATRRDFDAAGAKFRAAYALDPRADYTCNAGVAYWKAQQWPRAHRYLSRCAAVGSSVDKAFLDSLGPVIAAVDQKLAAGEFAPVELFVEPNAAEIVVDDEDPLIGPSRVWVAFGDHAVVVRARGFRDHATTITATSRDRQTLRIVLEPVPVEPPPTPVVTPVVTPIEATLVPPPPPRRSRTPALAATIATGVVGLAATGLYLRARSLATSAEATDIQFSEFEQRRDSARTYQRLSWIAGGVAGAGALLSGYLWYRATRSVELGVAASGAVTLRGRF